MRRLQWNDSRKLRSAITRSLPSFLPSLNMSLPHLGSSKPRGTARAAPAFMRQLRTISFEIFLVLPGSVLTRRCICSQVRWPAPTQSSRCKPSRLPRSTLTAVHFPPISTRICSVLFSLALHSAISSPYHVSCPFRLQWQCVPTVAIPCIQAAGQRVNRPAFARLVRRFVCCVSLYRPRACRCLTFAIACPAQTRMFRAHCHDRP